ncbi:heterogeneous nuclear ribonucleoprotein A3-like [Centruroides sculpturatus]|uniref:heterogeneous nuclear ribonucleoprotein A3-like n=1 Tax=Centruroides sculpturatus TaxID=218467 RepID=UPI000C6CED83|nr:heterogeneous nuclear ribonucleoprotein A3-like [Centruroides sculpturatus]
MNRPNAQPGGPPPKRGRWDPAGNSFSGGRRDYQTPGNTGYGDYGAAPDVQSTYLTGTDYQMNSQPPAEDYSGGYKMSSDSRTGYRGGYTAATTYPNSYNGGGYGESSYDGRGNYESYTNPAGAVSSYGKDYGPGMFRFSFF